MLRGRETGAEACRSKDKKKSFWEVNAHSEKMKCSDHRYLMSEIPQVQFLQCWKISICDVACVDPASRLRDKTRRDVIEIAWEVRPTWENSGSRARELSLGFRKLRELMKTVSISVLDLKPPSQRPMTSNRWGWLGVDKKAAPIIKEQGPKSKPYIWLDLERGTNRILLDFRDNWGERLWFYCKSRGHTS
jgi:hypothetical protein